MTANYAALEAATNYRAMDQAAIASVGVPKVGSTVTYPFSLGAGDTGAASGMEEERNAGLYFQFDGILHLDARNLKYNFGMRWVQTLQNIISPGSACRSAQQHTGGRRQISGHLYLPRRTAHVSGVPAVGELRL